MRRILGNQSELSFASAIFYFSGGVIAILSVTIFRSDQNPLNLANILTACSAILVAIVFLIAGRRARPEIAILVLCAAALLVLLLSSVAMNELRFVNSGLMFYTFVIYLVWFGPMWLARIFGYTWLACYWVIAIWRFGDDMYSMLVTLTISSAMLGELVGVFSRRLEASSLTDVLCGVWNKRGFQLLLSKAIRTARRGDTRLSMLFLDLDDFKGVNDSLGHAEGDRVLRAFAVQIEAGSRTGDTLARIGGDEFVLLMPETGADQADAVARRLREAVDVVSWSYGVAELLPGEGAEEFISRADQLMLEQKARRRAQRAEGGAADRLSS